MFTDTTVMQSVENGGCNKSNSGARSGDVCMIGTGTGKTDATIVRSIMDGEYQEILSEVEDNLIRAVDTVEASNSSDCWKEMGDMDSSDKACGKYCMKDADGFEQAFFKCFGSSLGVISDIIIIFKECVLNPELMQAIGLNQACYFVAPPAYAIRT